VSRIRDLLGEAATSVTAPGEARRSRRPPLQRAAIAMGIGVAPVLVVALLLPPLLGLGGDAGFIASVVLVVALGPLWATLLRRVARRPS